MDQMSFSLLPRLSVAGCGNCVCRTCMLWWSNRCPHGECFDDWRAANDPYDKAHPNEPARKSWSHWKTQQAWWCRGGSTYPVANCKDYVKYSGHEVRTCLCANISVFQDGYISCPIVDTVGCQACWDQKINDLKKRSRHHG